MDLQENPLNNLENFDISKKFGFILEDPLEELPDIYRPWIEIARDLPNLIENHELRKKVEELEPLSIHHLKGHKEQRLAHLALACITMGYVWQEREKDVKKVLPKVIAVPFYELSKQVGLPPIMVYADCVLANWKKKDPSGPLTYENMDTLFAFPGGDCSKGFFLVSLLVEKAAASAIEVIPDIFNAIINEDPELLKKNLNLVAKSLQDARQEFKLVHKYVNPDDFYGTLRIFLSGWKGNQNLKDGLLYEGVDTKPMKFSGGSAAQSSIIQCFDALLGIQHNTAEGKESAEFLNEMRDYMPVLHKNFLEAVGSGPSVREFIISREDTELKDIYNKCIDALVELRCYHLKVVEKYIIYPSNKCHGNKDGEERGTGGTKLKDFLQTVRNTTKKAHLN